MSGKLYIVGTPIGNLGDFSPRAVQTLEAVDFIAAEDTRVTVKLLNHFGIKKPMISYFEHNKAQKGDEITERLTGGQTCALVTDAGMPAISDPGEELVRSCHESGIPVETVPGPSALITALAASGMVSGRFCFEGFLSVNKKSRREHLSELVNEKRTMIFYEAPHKLPATLGDMSEFFGDREICLVRELTKIHEEIRRTTLNDAVRYYAENQPKGEFVLILAGAGAQEKRQMTADEAAELARELMCRGMSASSAARAAAEQSGVKKNEIYIKIVT